MKKTVIKSAGKKEATRSGKRAAPTNAAANKIGVAEASFLAAFESILVDEPVLFDFNGSLSRNHMRAVWSWLTRDIVPDFPQQIEASLGAGKTAEAAIDAELPGILVKVRDAVAASKQSAEAERKLIAQLTGEEVKNRLPVVMNALRCRPLLAKASAFGRASNSLPDEAALGSALQSMPLKEPGIAALLLHVVVGQSANPSRLISSIIPIAGGASEAAIKGAGLAPAIDAVLAHAQNQLSRLIGQNGLFADTDLICKAVSRFHKLIRSITGYIELERGSRWSTVTAEITKQMAQRIEPRLREVSADVSQSLRKPREGADRVDADRLLAALNGIYLLATLRDARDSLALNALFDTIWGETGQNLEILLKRNLELYKQDPGDSNAAHRLDMGIKMAEVRFNAEYADILRRARDSVGRRMEKLDDTA